MPSPVLWSSFESNPSIYSTLCCRCSGSDKLLEYGSAKSVTRPIKPLTTSAGTSAWASISWSRASNRRSMTVSFLGKLRGGRNCSKNSYSTSSRGYSRVRTSCDQRIFSCQQSSGAQLQSDFYFPDQLRRL